MEAVFQLRFFRYAFRYAFRCVFRYAFRYAFSAFFGDKLESPLTPFFLRGGFCFGVLPIFCLKYRKNTPNQKRGLRKRGFVDSRQTSCLEIGKIRVESVLQERSLNMSHRYLIFQNTGRPSFRVVLFSRFCGAFPSHDSNQHPDRICISGTFKWGGP